MFSAPTAHTREPLSSQRPPSRIRWILLLLCGLAIALPGIVGHGPWKQDETYSFGIVQSMIETGNYLVPMNAGQPFLEKPPLYYWTATFFAKLLSPVLALHDGARVASLFYMAVSGVFITRITRLAWNTASVFDIRTLATLALFATTVGMVRHAHDMFTDVGLICGSIIAFYGLLKITVNQRGPVRAPLASVWLGLGVGMTLLTKGMLMPVVYVAMVVCTPLLLKSCRSRSYVRAVALAALVALPLIVVWPAALAYHSVPLFMTWFWDNNLGRFLGFSVPQLGASNTRWLPVAALFQVLMPTTPLVLYAIFTPARRPLREPAMVLALLFSAILLTLLTLAASGRQLYYLPLSFPFALLAVHGIERMPLCVAAAWDWAARIVLGGAALLLWAIYVVSMMPVAHHHWLSPLARWLPIEFVTPFTPLPFAFALVLTLAWCGVLPRLKALQQWRGAFSWFTHMTLVWGIAFSVLLPWIDHSKSYESSFSDLKHKIEPYWRVHACMASIHLGESEAPMLAYFAGIVHTPIENPAAARCEWLIVQDELPLTRTFVRGRTARGLAVSDGEGNAAYWTVADGAGDPAARWRLFWSGARDGDDRQQIRVFRKNAASAP